MKGTTLSSTSRPWLMAAGCLLLAACCASVQSTVKIGLSAPFEGSHRDLGYEVLYAVQLAVRERNDEGGVGRRCLVEMVALNDFNEPQEAVAQAYEMYADPDVVAVLGGWSPEAVAAARPVYDQLGLTFLSPPGSWSGAAFPATAPIDAAFARRYEILSAGVPPGPAAAWAYAETRRLLDAVDAALRTGVQPVRGEVGGLLRSD
jgi:ABC-type branched-subunit amino acid transport system substrate-binding protein